jgi:hypothetical protein
VLGNYRLFAVLVSSTFWSLAGWEKVGLRKTFGNRSQLESTAQAVRFNADFR